MKAGVPWSVKGVEADAREAAKLAARRSGLTLGEWLNSMIFDRLEPEELPPPRYASARAPVAARRVPARHGDDREIHDRLDTLSEQLSQLAYRDFAGAAGHHDWQPSRGDRDRGIAEGLIARIERNEHRVASDHKAVGERLGRQEQETAASLAAMGERLGRCEQETATGFEALADQFSALTEQVAGSGGVATLSQRLERCERETAKELEALAGRLAAWTQRVAETGDLATLGGRLERCERETAKGLETLAERLSAWTGKFAESGDLTTLGERLERCERETAAELETLTDRVSALTALVAETGGSTALGARLERCEQETARGFAAIAGRLATLSEQVGETAALAALGERLDRSERESAQAIEAVYERLSALTAKVAEAAAGATFPLRPEDVPGFSVLEGAMRSIVEHIEITDQRNREALHGLQQQMSELAARTGQSGDDRAATYREALARLEQNFDTLAGQVAGVEAAAGDRRPVEHLDRRISQLGERLEAFEHGSTSILAQASDAAAERVQREFGDLERRLEDVVAELRSGAASRSANDAEVEHLRGEVRNLAGHVEELKAAASERDLLELQAAMEALSRQVSEAADLGPIAELERRLAELAARPGPSSAELHESPAFDRIEQRIRDLERRLPTSASGPHDNDALREVEAQIVAVGERLGAAERRFGRLAAVEHSIAQMQELLRMPAGTSAELRALEEGLAAVRASAEAADERNQETLQAVHDTLEKIIDRMTEIEERSGAAIDGSPAANAPVAGVAGDFRLPPIPEPFGPGVFDTASSAAAAAWSAAPEAIADDDVEESPSFDRAAAAPPVSPPPSPTATPVMDRIEPSFEPAASKATPHGAGGVHSVTRREDFIAAARRAAQAAAEAPQPAPSRRNPLHRFRRDTTNGAKAEPMGAQKPAADAPADPAGRRKRLIIAGALLVMMFSAYSWFAGRPKEPSTPVPADRPAASETLDRRGTEVTDPAAPQAETPDPAEAPEEVPAPPAPRGLAAAHTGMPAAEHLDGGRTVEAGAAGVPPATGSTRRGAEVPSAPPVALPALSPQAVDELLSPRVPASPSGSGATLAVAPEDGVTVVVKPALEPAARSTDIAKTPAPAAPAVEEEDLPAAIGPERVRAAALSGDPAAIFVVATSYLEGKTVPQDLAKAALWYQKVAAKGLAPAQYRLAGLFEHGKGVPQDPASARIWYERAAEKGHVKAMHNLAALFADASRGEPKYAKAAQWFRAAAEHGLKDSQFNIAVLHERGLGVARDDKEAFRWYSLAARQGDPDARQSAANVERRLTAADAAAIRAEIDKWQPRVSTQDANMLTVPTEYWQQAEARTPPGRALVSQIQAELMRLGYEVGKADGTMGTRTVNAIRLYQLRFGLTVSGTASAELLNHLRGQTG